MTAEKLELVPQPQEKKKSWNDIETVQDAQKWAVQIMKSGLAAGLRNNEQALILIATGAEMGLSPMQSIRALHIIEGKISPSADLIVALAKSSPACKYFKRIESTDVIARYETLREGDPSPTEMAYTIGDAKRAGLSDRRTWQKHPSEMLRARCRSALARDVYPDMCMGLYIPDELKDDSKKGRDEMSLVESPAVHRADWMRAHLRDLPGIGQKSHDTLKRMQIHDCKALLEHYDKGLLIPGQTGPNRERSYDALLAEFDPGRKRNAIVTEIKEAVSKAKETRKKRVRNEKKGGIDFVGGVYIECTGKEFSSYTDNYNELTKLYSGKAGAYINAARHVSGKLIGHGLFPNIEEGGNAVGLELDALFGLKRLQDATMKEFAWVWHTLTK